MKLHEKKSILEMVKETKQSKKAMWKAQDKYAVLRDRLIKRLIQEDLSNTATAWYTSIIKEL